MLRDRVPLVLVWFVKTAGNNSAHHVTGWATRRVDASADEALRLSDEHSEAVAKAERMLAKTPSAHAEAVSTVKLPASGGPEPVRGFGPTGPVPTREADTLPRSRPGELNEVRRLRSAPRSHPRSAVAAGRPQRVAL